MTPEQESIRFIINDIKNIDIKSLFTIGGLHSYRDNEVHGHGQLHNFHQHRITVIMFHLLLDKFESIIGEL